MAMNRLKTIFSLVLMNFMFSTNVLAQTGSEVEMADLMRSSGKIYVVVAVALIVMVGLILYMISIDRKISRMERRIKSSS